MDTNTIPRDLVEPSDDDTEFVFFSGKGGVGKSTVSCATATWLADNDYETLLVTTDPAPNLSDIFDQVIGHEVTEIEGIENLSAIEIDPDTAAEEYRQETIEPMRQLLGDDGSKPSKSSLTAPASRRSRPSTTSSTSWTVRSTTWWSSIPPRPATPSV